MQKTQHCYRSAATSTINYGGGRRRLSPPSYHIISHHITSSHIVFSVRGSSEQQRWCRWWLALPVVVVAAPLLVEQGVSVEVGLRLLVADGVQQQLVLLCGGEGGTGLVAVVHFRHRCRRRCRRHLPHSVSSLQSLRFPSIHFSSLQFTTVHRIDISNVASRCGCGYGVCGTVGTCTVHALLQVCGCPSHCQSPVFLSSGIQLERR
jgi:hypothetical protein